MDRRAAERVVYSSHRNNDFYWCFVKLFDMMCFVFFKKTVFIYIRTSILIIWEMFDNIFRREVGGVCVCGKWSSGLGN